MPTTEQFNKHMKQSYTSNLILSEKTLQFTIRIQILSLRKSIGQHQE